MHIVLENEQFLLEIDERCRAVRLLQKQTGEECLSGEPVPFCSVTQPRPFNNEVKLSNPNKRTEYFADRVRREGDTLIIGFAVAPYEARVDVEVRPSYIRFTLAGFDVHPQDYEGLMMTPPPVEEFRLCALPVRERACFGTWMNVCHDDGTAVAVMAASPEPRIDSELRGETRLLTADALRAIRLTGVSAAVFCAPKDGFLDAVRALEADRGFFRGVDSRRGGAMNHSVYFTSDICPANVDEHIGRAKQGGFRLMQIYYTAFCHEENGYSFCGDYDFNSRYPGGYDDLRALLAKLKANGITPGLHVLQTHIGMRSRYVTPHCDSRLRLWEQCTLAKPLGMDDTVIEIEQDPWRFDSCEKRRVLRFGTELIRYTGCTSERPYCFTGCERGAFGTGITEHAAGTIGGQLDISEFGATSCYIDETTSLQDEIAKKIASFYDCGFAFLYLDGSEGVNPPYEYYVSYAQSRVLRALASEPLFVEGAAKSHFGWHWMSGGNAFDIFPPLTFKEMLVRHPLAEAPHMRMDFTGLNFGWWGFWTPDDGARDPKYVHGTQADQYEFGTALAAAWDCPVSVQTDLKKLRAHPRTDDILEVMRRWEDVRANGLMTDEWREALRDGSREYTLLRTAEGGYELCEYRRAECGVGMVTAYTFRRNGMTRAVWWHDSGSTALVLPVDPARITLCDETGAKTVPPEACPGGCVLPADGKRYLCTDMTEEELRKVFAAAEEE